MGDLGVNSDIDFIDRAAVPLGSTVGFHKHDDSQEMYMVLEGSGVMKNEGDDAL